MPVNPAPPKEYFRKNFILIAEDANLIPSKENEKMWGSHLITKTLLSEFFYLIDTIGLHDAHPRNAWFSQDGNLCFIDTEGYGIWPIEDEILINCLSKNMQTYWKKLNKSKIKKSERKSL